MSPRIDEESGVLRMIMSVLYLFLLCHVTNQINKAITFRMRTM